MNMATLLLINTVLFGILFCMWQRNDWFNLFIKTSLLFATLANIYALFKLS